MNIEVNDKIIEQLGDIPELMGETIEEYVKRAILTQLKIDTVVLEKDILPSDEMYEYPVLAREAVSIERVLKNKGFDVEVVTDPENRKNVKIKANVKPKDFDYLVSLKDKHKMVLKVPSGEITEQKMEQLQRMFSATAFTYVKE